MRGHAPTDGAVVEPVHVESVRPRSRWWVIVPVLTLLIGAGGGAAGMWYANRHDSNATTAQSAPTTSAPAPSPSGSANGPLPRPCLDVTRDAGDAGDILRQAASAVASFDLTKLQHLVDRAETVQNRLTQDVNACQDGA
jgi:hypothetical protein